jgi:hydroxymethylbilane synthase
VLVRIGSRGSRLALTQAEQAAAALRGPGVEIAFVPITTAGDRDRSSPFGQIGARGVFVKEIEEALLAGRIDVAVHSAKDMTSTDTEGLVIGAFLERDDPRDALVGAEAIEAGMRIGTASARRRAQLLSLEPSLVIEPLRGNVDTRLRKQRERGLDAIVLAACGLDRLGLDAAIGARLDPVAMLPEAAQGALALQVRAGEEVLVARADHAETRRRVEPERRCVAVIGAGCLAPVAAHHDGERLHALIAAEDGAWIERRAGEDPEALAGELLALAAARDSAAGRSIGTESAQTGA